MGFYLCHFKLFISLLMFHETRSQVLCTELQSKFTTSEIYRADYPINVVLVSTCSTSTCSTSKCSTLPIMHYGKGVLRFSVMLHSI